MSGINITAADAIGTPPITAINCPVDDEKVKADDLQRIAAAALANDDYRADQIATLGPGLLAANNTWTGTNAYSNAVALNGGATATTKVVLSGNGAGIRYRWGDVSDTDATINTTKDAWLCEAASAPRVLTLSVSTGTIPQDGEEVTVLCVGALGGYYDVYYEGSGSAMITGLGSSSTDAMATFIYRASTTRWYLKSATGGTVGSNALG
jgi:hypothetical protein